MERVKVLGQFHARQNDFQKAATGYQQVVILKS